MSPESPSSADARVTPRPKYPYPGLRAFEASEWSIFFGREAMIDEVIDRLAAHRLVLIHGSSGAGKSSLVRAGVLPKLERQHRLAGMPWQTCAMRPSGGPLWNLAKQFARLEGDAEDADRVGQIVGEFSRRGATISSAAASLKRLDGRHLCILVDQFEELFRFEKESREEAELFVDLVVRSNVEAVEGAGSAANSDGQAAAVHVVITMRSEFLGECARFNGLAEAINRTQYLVPRMERDALLRAIRRPAQLYNGEVSLDLAERLIADAAGREDELPLIQHGLMLMWHDAVAKVQSSGSTVLDAAPLEAAGGLMRMLSAHADAVVEAAAPDPERRYAVERLFRALTDVNVEGKAIRRPQVFRDLVAVIEIDADKLRAIIDALRRDGVSFLTPYPPQPIDETTPIDIGHEALIRCWYRISNPRDGWLKREFDDGLIWRSLLVEARSFERDNRRVLSPASIEERWDWWREQKLNSSWAERYGDNFSLVSRFLAASREAAADAKRGQRLVQGVIYVLLVGIIAGLLAWINEPYIVEEWRWQTIVRPFMVAKVHPYVLTISAEKTLKPKDTFRECAPERGKDYCPDMIVVPAGSFTMGSPPAEKGRGNDEGPQHAVTTANPSAVSEFELTFDEWDTCVTYGDCPQGISDGNWGRGKRPVINVTWEDARRYATWLSKITGKPYRLLSEAEYEYAARAGSRTIYPWGDDVGRNHANCNGCGSAWDNVQTAPVGSFAANDFGLFDMIGNVWEWTEDCYHESYKGVPTDGSAWVIACTDDRRRLDRGGSWYSSPERLRSAARLGNATDYRSDNFGFRLARTLTP
jgi:formylglycine-generating enzyme required for sulfatase activity